MPQAEQARPGRMGWPAVTRRLHGWGGGPGAPARVLAPDTVAELCALVAGLGDGTEAMNGGPGTAGVRNAAIARGMGRSYGDAAQLRGGTVLDTTGLKRIELDPRTGTVLAEAGVTIGELLARALPAGWTVPVVPGTQHVSLGGAVASDIHGKNHGLAGTFSRHVERLGLVDAAGELYDLGPEDDLFQATAGGMGLTGVIAWTRVRLAPVRSALVSVDTDRVECLEAALQALRAPGGPHRVAWLDLLSSRPRGIVTRAEHADGEEGTRRPGSATVRARATVPSRWPGGLLRPLTMRAFNAVRFRAAPRRERGRLESVATHMFPLDALAAWPRLYGPAGFVQYQFVVPSGRTDVLAAVIEHLRRARVPCYLCVLKDFGPAGPAPLSFPIEGWTITFDLPRSAPGLYGALDVCDELVVAGGGRVYLAKDDRLRPATLAAMYPRLAEWQRVRDRADPDRLWSSDLGRRTGLVPGGRK